MITILCCFFTNFEKVRKYYSICCQVVQVVEDCCQLFTFVEGRWPFSNQVKSGTQPA